MRCAGFFLFFQCGAFAFSPSFIHSITPQSLKEYVTLIPNHTAQQWLQNNADFLAYLARMPYPLSTWQGKYEDGNWHLFKRGLKNNGYTNFIFQIPATNYWIQIGGPKHRVRNIYTYNTRKNSYWYVEIAKHWELRNSSMIDAFELVPTYQTISRYAYYLLLEQTIEQLHCEHIQIAPTYLVHIPGYSTLVCDEHYIVAQKHINGLVRLRDVPERLHDIPDHAINELFQVICATGYWNIKNGLYIDPENNLVLLDYEQRNIENPEDFFYKDLRSFENCVFNGIEELAHIHLKQYAPHAYQQLLVLIAKQANLRYSSCWPNFVQLLNSN